MPHKSMLPQTLCPYTAHGLDLTVNSSGTQALGDCPWCGKEGKFTVEVREGLWRCLSCNEGSSSGNGSVQGGNSQTFLRLLYDYSCRQKHVFVRGRLLALANERRLDAATLQAWGITTSLLIAEDFLLPGFGVKGAVNQLYRYLRVSKNGVLKWVTWPTPRHDVTLFGLNPNLYDPDKETIYLCEGAWDAMALWEALQRVKWVDEEGGELALTSNREKSLGAGANVLAVPGALTFKARWSDVFAGKKVVLLFDNDHSRVVNGQERGCCGWRGMRSVAGILQTAPKPPASLHYLQWGDAGYDPNLPDGFDVRDWLTLGREAGKPNERVKGLFQRVRPVPLDWTNGKTLRINTGAYGMLGSRCLEWRKLMAVWEKALRMRQSLEDCLAVMLAVCLSTDQVGDQLFLQLIAEAGSAKTKLCEALLTSSYCYPLEKMKGFTSGWKGEDDTDYSLLARINHKTLITSEGDLLLSSPNFQEIMSEQRRIFDGSTSSSYRNRKEDRMYTGLRTPWIIAGTPALLNRADVHLGDRFLRAWIDKPDTVERREIQKRAARAADANTLHISNGVAEKTLSPTMCAAYKATGGYVDYLRTNVEELLQGVVNPDWAIEQCIALAQFTAYLRSRPDPNPHSEMVCSEEPTRLVQQFVRLAKNLAAVLGKKEVDAEVMRKVRKVAFDTAKGLTYELVRLCALGGSAGVENQTFALRTGESYDKRLRGILVFLAKIGVVETFKPSYGAGVRSGKQRWQLSERMSSLYLQVLRGGK